MQNPSALKDELTKVVDDLIADADIELFELNIHYSSGVSQIEVIIDKTHGGISLEECSWVNQQLVNFIDRDQLVAGEYTVEVSSPGLDRPLKTVKDFNRVLGQDIRVHLKEKAANKIEHVGVLEEVLETGIKLKTKKDVLSLPFEIIQKAVPVF